MRSLNEPMGEVVYLNFPVSYRFQRLERCPKKAKIEPVQLFIELNKK